MLIFIFLSLSLYTKGTFHCWNWENTGKQNDEIRDKNSHHSEMVMAIIFLFISNMKLADIWHGDWFSEGVAFLWWEDKHGRYDFQPRLTCVKRTPQIWVHQGTENKSKWMDSHPVYIPESDLGEWPWKCWRLEERKWGKQLWPGRASQIWHTANFMMSS